MNLFRNKFIHIFKREFLVCLKFHFLLLFARIEETNPSIKRNTFISKILESIYLDVQQYSPLTEYLQIIVIPQSSIFFFFFNSIK